MTWAIEPEQRAEIRRQIDMNILPISGGRVVAIADGIGLPAGSGYTVRVQLTPADEYTVSRVFRRAGREWIHGHREHVYCDRCRRWRILRRASGHIRKRNGSRSNESLSTIPARG